MNDNIVWSPGVTLRSIEKQVIFKAFQFFRNNKTATAQALGISIRTLDSRFEEYAKEDKSQEIFDAEHRRTRELQLARARGFAPAEQRQPAIQAKDQGHLSHETDEGLHMESPSDTSAQQPLSLSQRPKIQEMLPKQVAASGGRKSR